MAWRRQRRLHMREAYIAYEAHIYRIGEKRVSGGEKYGQDKKRVKTVDRRRGGVL